MAEEFDSVTGYWENGPMCGTDCYQVNDLERSANGMNGLPSVGFCGQVVILTEILMSFRGRSEVVWELIKLAKY